MIQLTNSNDVEYLVGGKTTSIQPIVPYDDIICSFLNDLSNTLRKNKKANKYSDIVTFAFWCRKANILRQKKIFLDDRVRLGLGLVFHITPSNIPVNFAFSFVFGLLSGNANLVRLPTNPFPQVEIICSTINKLFSLKKYHELKIMNTFVRYDKNDNISSIFSKYANARVIWGGDETIKTVRKLPSKERSIDITFADKYSICIINSNKLYEIDKKKLDILGNNFFNDTYLMDQNACSSPHLIIWIGDKIEVARGYLWKTIFNIAKEKYELNYINAVEKYSKICSDAIDLDEVEYFQNYSNVLYLVGLRRLPKNIHTLRGRNGYFYEFRSSDLDPLVHIVNNKYQTLTYYGLNKSDIKEFIVKNRLSGIDRVVPIGKALDISVNWDGYDIISCLSRIITVE